MNKFYNVENLKAMDYSDDEFIKHIVKIFLETVPDNSEQLVIASENNNWDKVYFFSHKMKSNINLLNIESLKEDILYVEQNAKSKTNLNTLHDKIISIKKIVADAAKEMREDFSV